MKTTIDARCDRCKETATGSRDELEADAWLPCPRKGGKLAWMCPQCNPTTKPLSRSMGLSTPDVAPQCDSDEAVRSRARAAFVDTAPPPPELYEELLAAGSWPLAVSKEMAEAYWKARRGSARGG